MVGRNVDGQNEWKHLRWYRII